MSRLTRKQMAMALSYMECGNWSQASREAGYATIPPKHRLSGVKILKWIDEQENLPVAPTGWDEVPNGEGLDGTPVDDEMLQEAFGNDGRPITIEEIRSILRSALRGERRLPPGASTLLKTLLEEDASRGGDTQHIVELPVQGVLAEMEMVRIQSKDDQ